MIPETIENKESIKKNNPFLIIFLILLFLSYFMVFITVLGNNVIFKNNNNFLFALMSSFSILFVCGFYSVNLFQYNEANREIGQIMFMFSMIISTGVTTSSIFVLVNLLFFGSYKETNFIVFLVLITIINFYIIIKHIKTLKTFFLRFQTIKENININFGTSLWIILFLGVFLWINDGFGKIIYNLITNYIFGYTFNGLDLSLFNYTLYLSLFFLIGLISIRKEKKVLTISTIFFILLLTRTAIYKKGFIIGGDSLAHYDWFKQIIENPLLIFDFSNLVHFAPITYSWMYFLNIYGSAYLLPASFIIISSVTYIAIYSLGIIYSNFKASSLALLIASIEFTTFRFGFEIRTSIIGFLYLVIWLFTVLNIKNSKKGWKDDIIHISVVLLISLTHFTTFLFVIAFETILSFFYLSEKFILINYSKEWNETPLPKFTKMFLVPFPFYIVALSFLYKSNQSISWLIDVLTNKNPKWSLIFDLTSIPGLTTFIYSIQGSLIIWISRFLFFFIIITTLIKFRKKILDSFIRNVSFRLFLYMFTATTIVFLLSIIVPLITPSRTYVLMIIYMGYIVGFSDKYLKITEKWEYYIDIVCIFFLLNTLVRLPYYLSLEVFYLLP